MKTTHTPGPWETGSKMSQVITWRDGRPVPMFIADCDHKYAPNSEDERCANARLIAAAPELLEACKFVLAHLDPLQDHPKTQHNLCSDCLSPKPTDDQSVVEYLKEAISKAEGQS